jgi:hypothetical protein
MSRSYTSCPLVTCMALVGQLYFTFTHPRFVSHFTRIYFNIILSSSFPGYLDILPIVECKMGYFPASSAEIKNDVLITSCVGYVILSHEVDYTGYSSRLDSKLVGSRRMASPLQ